MTYIERIFTQEDKNDVKEAFKDILIQAFKEDLRQYMENEYMFSGGIIDEMLEEIVDEVRAEAKKQLKKQFMDKMMAEMEAKLG